MSDAECGVTAHLQPTVANLRVFEQGRQYTEPYYLSAEVVFLKADVVEIRGVDKPILPHHWRAIRRTLVRAGVRAVEFDRGQRRRRFRFRREAR